MQRYFPTTLRCLAIAVALLLFSVNSAASPEWATLDDCDQEVLRHSDELDAWSCYWKVGSFLNQRQDAARRLEAHLALNSRNPAARLNLALLYGEMGRYDQAEIFYKESADQFEDRGQAKGEGYARISLAMMLIYFQRYDDALPELVRTEQLGEEAGDDELLAMALSQSANMALKVGNLGAAQARYSRLHQLLQPDGPLHLRSWALSGLGNISWQVNQLDKAAAYFREEADLLLAAGFKAQAAGPLYSLAMVLANSDARGGAFLSKTSLTMLQGALRSSMEIGNISLSAQIHGFLAEILDGEQSVLEAEKGLAILIGGNRPREETMAVLGLASCMARQPDPDLGKITLLLDRSEALAKNHEPRLLDEVHSLQARIALMSGDAKSAVELALASLLIHEQNTVILQNREMIDRYQSAAKNLFSRAIDIIQATDPSGGEHTLALIFWIMERYGAGSLLARLHGEDRSLEPVDPVRAARYKEMVEEITSIQRQLLSAGTSDRDRVDLTARLEELESEEFTFKMEGSRTGSSDLPRRPPSIPALAQVQEMLGPNQAMVRFWVGNLERFHGCSRAWAQVLTRNTVELIPLPDRREIMTLVDAWTGLVERRDGLDVQAGVRFHGQVLEEVLNSLPDHIQDLVIVPDGELNRIPPGAMRRSVGEQPLAVRYAITVVPSAATWASLQELQPSDTAGGVLAVADPALPAQGQGGLRDSGAWMNRPALNALPGTRQEASRVRKIIGRNSKTLTGEMATESTLKKITWGDYSMVLLAAHTLVDDRHLQRSGIYLVPGSDDEDGLLQEREILNLDLAGQVVVLSGCSSATGEYLEGEGVLGLSRAFFMAGAATVVGSLWPLEDREAARFTSSMAESLADGNTVAQAVQQAQRKMIRSGAPTQAWAGMVVMGNGDFRPFPDAKSKLPRYLAWFVILAFAVLAIRYNR